MSPKHCSLGLWMGYLWKKTSRLFKPSTGYVNANRDDCWFEALSLSFGSLVLAVPVQFYVHCNLGFRQKKKTFTRSLNVTIDFHEVKTNSERVKD